MSRIRLQQPHSYPRDEVRDRLDAFEQAMSKYGVSLKWSGNDAVIQGFGVSGSIQVQDATVDVELKLGMMAKAAGVDPVRLEKSIRKRLVAALE